MIEKLIHELPEVYQPVYGHESLSNEASRKCLDRLEKINSIYESLERQFGRPLRVLDLGCAQGFFSFSLAAKGATVCAIDYNHNNIKLCKALLEENPRFNLSFEIGRMEQKISTLKPEQYDLVLGLSVFHHIIHEKGIEFVKDLLEKIAASNSAMILELALQSEPLYWAEHQPENPLDLIKNISFVKEIGLYETHLSSISRPMYFVSNHHLIAGELAFKFDFFNKDPHKLANNVYSSSRKYFFGEKFVAKQLIYNGSLDKVNKLDFLNSKKYLQSPVAEVKTAELLAYEESKSEAIIVMERLPGNLLLDLITNGAKFDKHAVLSGILKQLALLEEAGFYHNDLRVWNVLLSSNGSISLIDYDSIVREKVDCAIPKDLLISFFYFVYEVSSCVVIKPELREFLYITPFALPEPYNKWANNLWSLPLDQLSFRKMYSTLPSKPKTATLPPPDTQDTNNLWSDAFTFFESHAIDRKGHINASEKHAHEAQVRANDAENRANEAEARANEAQSKFSAFEVAAQLAESRATSAMIELQKTQAEVVVRDRELEKQNIQLKETNEKLADYKRLINNKEQISLELQQQLNRQEQSALELQIKLETAEQDRLNLHEQLDDKEQASLELQKQLEEQEQEAIRLREELADSLESLNLVAKELEDSTKFNEHIRLESQTLSEELAKTRSELHEVHQSNHHHFTESQNLSAELKKTRSELHEVHQSNHHHFTESQNLSAELEKTRSELHEVHQSNHHHFLESQAYKKQLDAMYKSKSWLITTPFRWIGDLIRFLLRLPRLIIVTILRYLIAFLQKPISMLMRWVIGKPKLKARALTTLKRFPGLSHQLRGIAQRYGLIHHQPVVSTESHTAPTETDNNTTPKIEPDSKLMEINHDLSPRAQKIYLDLKQAIEQYKKEGE